ncbi:MAG: hypothetical protein HYZ47_03160 [Simkania negevensis]|nr:hypothetical protein [Simkania negevensis]
MKLRLPLFMSLLSLILFGCQNSKPKQDEEIVSKRYIHKYGYDVSREEWEGAGYPGQVLTTLRNGITVVASYEDGLLHGETTHTYPHSQTIESKNTYERGHLVKKVTYDIRGIPYKEEVFLSPSHLKTTRWYKNGTPMSMEETHNQELISAEYYNTNNEIEFRVASGSGTRVIRDEHEQIVAKELIKHGYPSLRESFHPHGVPQAVTPLANGKIEGERKVYAPSGEPISIENYHNNVLEGLATYFQNGCRYLEVNYRNGLKDGKERHYVDGETIVEETEWMDGQKHGPSIIYFDGMSKTRWYYNNALVSKEKYRELCEQEENIAIMNDRAKSAKEE